jgi:2-succinyl-6-hydroxy-2,4-cyclohexadiene-1-carboxylate synthase
MGAGRQDYLMPLLPRLPMAVLLVAGELDAKYTELGRSMAAVLPAAEVEIVAGAGHSVHLEQPQAFGRVTSRFLQRHLTKKEVAPE